MAAVKSMVFSACVLFCLCVLFLVLSDRRQLVASNSPREALMGGHSLTRDSGDFIQTSFTSQQGSFTTQDMELSVEDSVAECMRATHISSTVREASSLLEQATSNAKHLYREYRTVIPQNSLSGYGSYCWKVPYSMTWTRSEYSGRIGNLSFGGKMSDIDYSSSILAYANTKFLNHRFSSDLACIPKVFLAGFPKCGSTFAYCLINQLFPIKADTSLAVKEPHFWVVMGVKGTSHVPVKKDLGKYLFYYLPGIQEISSTVKNKLILMDGAANKMFKWPKFSEADHDLANYCLLPSVLPRLIPSSKFIVVMRDPVSMLYSTFWYSCSRQDGTLSLEMQLKGPDMFHNRIVNKINLFNACMRDSSVPSISHTCELGRGQDYSSCILHPDRLVLLSKCTHEINFDNFTSDMPECGRTRVTMGLYYVHIHKWLSVVSRERFLFLTLEDLIHDPNRCRYNLLHFLGLNTDIASKRWTVDSCSHYSQKEVDYKNNPRLQMRKDTRELLESFYAPFNELLSHLLQKNLLWPY